MHGYALVGALQKALKHDMFPLSGSRSMTSVPGLARSIASSTCRVDFIKIDGQFVRGMADDPNDRAIVASINDIAHSLGKRTPTPARAKSSTH